jgi:hypothetical protein
MNIKLTDNENESIAFTQVLNACIRTGGSGIGQDKTIVSALTCVQARIFSGRRDREIYDIIREIQQSR